MSHRRRQKQEDIYYAIPKKGDDEIRGNATSVIVDGVNTEYIQLSIDFTKGQKFFIEGMDLSEKNTNEDCKYCPENETNVMFSEPLTKETYEFEESEEYDEEQNMGSYKKTIKDEYNVDEENEYRDPYIIAPEQYGEDIDYHLVELTYYAGDNKLVDEDWRVIKNVEELVGKDALSSFGEYEDDAVHVRNERLQTEYEILLDERKYEDVMNK